MKLQKLFLLTVFSLFFSQSLMAECNVAQQYSYSRAKTFKEKENNNSFNQAMKIIIPVPYPVKAIEGKISNKNDIDYYLIYLTRPSDFRIIYSGYSGFAPAVILYNQYKQYIGIKTYASSVRANFNSNMIDFKIFKPGFYFLKISNLTNSESFYVYKIKIIPLDLTLYPQIRKKCYKKMINNLNQSTLHNIFYKEIIKKFKNMEEYKRFR